MFITLSYFIFKTSNTSSNVNLYPNTPNRIDSIITERYMTPLYLVVEVEIIKKDSMIKNKINRVNTTPIPIPNFEIW